MSLKRLLGTLLFLIFLSTTSTKSQIVVPNDEKDYAFNSDSVRAEFDKGPYFGLYKDNYFIFGTALGEKSTKMNTNVKFQISISQKLTKSKLPWGTYLYLFYTQKATWNVLQESMPFYDLNFNPGIGLSKPLFVGDKFIGKASFIIEHESNGKDSIWSRSWNRIAFAANIVLDPNIMVFGKFIIPIVDGENNKDLMKYTGYFQGGMQLISNDKKFFGSVMLTKRGNWKLDFNTVVELGLRLGRNSNEYLFVQYYNGYCENLLDYNKFASELRVGIVIRPKYFSDY